MDAMMQCKAKSENLAQILGYQTGAVIVLLLHGRLSTCRCPQSSVTDPYHRSPLGSSAGSPPPPSTSREPPPALHLAHCRRPSTLRAPPPSLNLAHDRCPPSTSREPPPALHLTPAGSASRATGEGSSRSPALRRRPPPATARRRMTSPATCTPADALPNLLRAGGPPLPQSISMPNLGGGHGRPSCSAHGVALLPAPRGSPSHSSWSRPHWALAP